jgi:hypothetical protein
LPTVKLSPDLEKALIHGVITGTCSPEIIKPEELSKKGKAVYGAIEQLIRKGGKPPFRQKAVTLAAVHLCGLEKDSVESYLASAAEANAGQEASTVLLAARDKATLINLVNQAGEQLASGDLRISDLTSILNEQHRASVPLHSLSKSLGKKWPKQPRGFAIPSLPALSEATRGIFGVWAVAAEPGVGKSTLCWQIAIDVSASFPVVYYDLDGTGAEFLIDRTRSIFDGNMVRVKRRTKNLFLRTSIATLEEDMARFKPPCLFVIDSLQTLPVGIKFAKESLDNWVRRFKDMSTKGYAVLCVSEKQRSEYGEANLNGFKGSGDIEYGVTVGIQLLTYEDDENLHKCFLVKGRHSRKKGHIIDLERDSKRVFWFNEREPYIEDETPKKRKFD